MEKVSLILTTYNCRENLKRTLESIEAQSYSNIQVVIKDGGSTDGTLEMVQDYALKSSHEVIWCSEGDKGLYDAMNRGYTLANGEIIAFFNDIYLTSDAVAVMVNAINEVGEGLVGAHADLIYATDDKVKRYWKTGNGDIHWGWMPGHPTLFLRREVYEKFGLYNSAYRCSADYEFMVRILKDKEVKLNYVPRTIVRMFYGGTSTNSSKAYWVSIKEAYQALKDNQIYLPAMIVCLRTFRTIPQFFKGKHIKNSPMDMV